MGVTCLLKSATREQIALMLRDPRLVEPFLTGDPETYPPTFFQRLLRRGSSVPGPILAQDDCMEISLEKSWHGLHFLFTGTAWEGEIPAASLVKGGRELEGAARVHSPEEAVAFRDFVHGLSEDELRDRFDPDAMTRLDIYPTVIWQRDGMEALDELIGSYHFLWAFLRDVVDEGHGFVIEIA